MMSTDQHERAKALAVMGHAFEGLGAALIAAEAALDRPARPMFRCYRCKGPIGPGALCADPVCRARDVRSLRAVE
jgi:hypothetical protein